MSGGFGEGIREIAALRARRRAGERSAPPLTESANGGPAAGAGSLREGIAALLRGDGSGSATAPGSPESRPGADLREADLPHREEGLSEIPGAGFHEIGGERVFAIVRPVDELLPGRDLHDELRSALARLDSVEECDLYRGLRPARGHAAADVAVMDLETTGFWGCTIFLVGLLVQDDGRFVTWQFLARDYPEERAVLRAAAEVAGRCGLLVSFNGKSYDVPCFRERARFHRVKHRLTRLAHVDVIHAARRHYRHDLPDCRLQTLEQSVIGIARTGDVPSAEIPALYHRFAATGEVARLLPVLHHSRVDVVTTALLFARVAHASADEAEAVAAERRSERAAEENALAQDLIPAGNRRSIVP